MHFKQSKFLIFKKVWKNRQVFPLICHMYAFICLSKKTPSKFVAITWRTVSQLWLWYILKYRRNTRVTVWLPATICCSLTAAFCAQPTSRQCLCLGCSPSELGQAENMFFSKASENKADDVSIVWLQVIIKVSPGDIISSSTTGFCTLLWSLTWDI